VGLALPVVIGVTVTVTSCGSAATTASSAASATASASAGAVSGSPTVSAVASSSPAPASVPAGYKRVGGAAQGISLAAPASWTAVDLAKETAAVAASKVSTTDISNASLVQDMQALQKLHAVAVWDVNTAANSSQHFVRNLNAYCFQGAGVDVGAAGVPQLKSNVASQLGSQGLTNITQQDLTIGGIPGVETSYQTTSSTAGTIYGAQLEVVPKLDDVCVVTESYSAGQSAGNVLNVAAATAQFP
jgi:hypothetical protein